jgi:hypothetical protein
MSVYHGNSQPPGTPGYPPQPAKQGTSVLAVVGFILAFCGGPLGFILSLIAVFQTGRNRQKGRGLAIAGVVVSLVIMAGGTAAYLALSSSTVLDPGCTDGKAAILAYDPSADAAGIQTTIDDLNAAADKAKNEDVRAAMKALANDYAEMKKGVETGTIPEGIVGKVATDAARVDELCTVGS